MADLQGVGRLAIDGTTGVTDLVAALQTRIARTPAKLGGPLVDGAVQGIARLVYGSIHGVTRVVGGGLDAVLARLGPLLGELESSPTREALLAALNGVLGDYLAATHNPLAIEMKLQRDGKPLELAPAALVRDCGPSRSKLLVLVHGLCLNDLQWRQDGHDHGAALARDLGYAAVYLHYNSGLHVSTNGQAFARCIEELLAAWPEPLAELTILGHSMGGLVARSAVHYGTVAGQRWPGALRKLVFLGTPHHGAPLERGGHWIELLIGATPYAGPLQRLGRVRSAGITDLRHGCLLDEDWEGRDRFSYGDESRRPVPLPERVACFAIAGHLGTAADGRQEHLFGDGLVPVASALGRHADPRFALGFSLAQQWIAHDTGHLDLLSRPAVYQQLRDWLAACAGAPR